MKEVLKNISDTNDSTKSFAFNFFQLKLLEEYSNN